MPPSLHAITGFALVTADPGRLVGFYRDVLGFAVHGAGTPVSATEMALLGLHGAGSRHALSLGGQSLVIDHFDTPGRAYPIQTNAAAACFQHLALVVQDIGAAFARLGQAVAISQGGPQQLPASSGAVQAFKFRDPDGHPLELLQFPADSAPPAWLGRQPFDGQIGLGIDHSAISVADAPASQAFYQALGMTPGTPSLNSGRAQERLDGLGGVEVDVLPLLPATRTPHLELLGYRSPRGQASPTPHANDIAATRILWRGSETRLIRDPDGHLQQVHP